jgi:hypothetical protein
MNSTFTVQNPFDLDRTPSDNQIIDEFDQTTLKNHGTPYSPMLSKSATIPKIDY